MFVVDTVLIKLKSCFLKITLFLELCCTQHQSGKLGAALVKSGSVVRTAVSAYPDNGRSILSYTTQRQKCREMSFLMEYG